MITPESLPASQERAGKLLTEFKELMGPSWVEQAGQLKEQYPSSTTKIFQPGEVEARTEFATGMVGPQALTVKGLKWVQDVVTPSLRTGGQDAAAAIRAASGQAARDKAITMDKLEPCHRQVNAMPEPERLPSFNISKDAARRADTRPIIARLGRRDARCLPAAAG